MSTTAAHHEEVRALVDYAVFRVHRAVGERLGLDEEACRSGTAVLAAVERAALNKGVPCPDCARRDELRDACFAAAARCASDNRTPVEKMVDDATDVLVGPPRTVDAHQTSGGNASTGQEPGELPSSSTTPDGGPEEVGTTSPDPDEHRGLYRKYRIERRRSGSAPTQAVERLTDAASKLVQAYDGWHDEGCRAFGAGDDADLPSDPSDADPQCTCGGVALRDEVRALLVSLDDEPRSSAASPECPCRHEIGSLKDALRAEVQAAADSHQRWQGAERALRSSATSNGALGVPEWFLAALANALRVEPGGAETMLLAADRAALNKGEAAAGAEHPHTTALRQILALGADEEREDDDPEDLYIEVHDIASAALWPSLPCAGDHQTSGPSRPVEEETNMAPPPKGRTPITRPGTALHDPLSNAAPAREGIDPTRADLGQPDRLSKGDGERLPDGVTAGETARSSPSSGEAAEDRLRAALQLAIRWMGDPADPLGTFEDIGDWFYRETFFLRPGKSEPLECGGRDEEREAAWKDWTKRTRESVYETCRAALSAPSSGEAEDPDLVTRSMMRNRVRDAREFERRQTIEACIAAVLAVDDEWRAQCKRSGHTITFAGTVVERLRALSAQFTSKTTETM